MRAECYCGRAPAYVSHQPRLFFAFKSAPASASRFTISTAVSWVVALIKCNDVLLSSSRQSTMAAASWLVRKRLT